MPYQGLDVERPALGANGWILMYCKSQQLSHGEMPRLFLIDLTGNNERESTHADRCFRSSVVAVAAVSFLINKA
jgi:hypothetical protein